MAGHHQTPLLPRSDYQQQWQCRLFTGMIIGGPPVGWGGNWGEIDTVSPSGSGVAKDGSASTLCHSDLFWVAFSIFLFPSSQHHKPTPVAGGKNVLGLNHQHTVFGWVERTSFLHFHHDEETYTRNNSESIEREREREWKHRVYIQLNSMRSPVFKYRFYTARMYTLFYFFIFVQLHLQAEKK